MVRLRPGTACRCCGQWDGCDVAASPGSSGGLASLAAVGLKKAPHGGSGRFMAGWRPAAGFFGPPPGPVPWLGFTSRQPGCLRPCWPSCGPTSAHCLRSICSSRLSAFRPPPCHLATPRSGVLLGKSGSGCPRDPRSPDLSRWSRWGRRPGRVFFSPIEIRKSRCRPAGATCRCIGRGGCHRPMRALRPWANCETSLRSSSRRGLR